MREYANRPHEPGQIGALQSKNRVIVMTKDERVGFFARFK